MRQSLKLISPAEGAASRLTRDLLAKHGPAFYVVGTSVGHEDRPGLLVKSLSGWIGWLPYAEVDVNDMEA